MTYAISDIHGEYDLFLRLLEKVGFSDDDILISCGDVVDKGQRSIKLLKFMLAMPNAVMINGNHEYDLLKYYRALAMQFPSSPNKVLSKLGKNFPSESNALDEQTIATLAALPYYYEIDGAVFVHAGVPLDSDTRPIPLHEALKEELVYDRNFKDPVTLPDDPRCFFFGHTPTQYICGEPKILTYPRSGTHGACLSELHKVHLDTGVYLSGVLGCFRLDDCASFYVDR